jgi:DNA polymerase-4
MKDQPGFLAVPGFHPLVLHVDMDAFFASVEIRSDPRLRDQPVAVGGGPGDRGVVTAASYPARRFGIHAGMSASEARNHCPALIFVPVDPAKMIHESLQVLAVLDGISPRVEPASIDEAYLEFPPSPAHQWLDRARALADHAQRAVLRERGLTCSVGAGVNKLHAKMASSVNKPHGSYLVPLGGFLNGFGACPVSSIPGVGPKSTEVLAALGILTVRDLAEADTGRLQERFGVWAVALRAQARGEGPETILAVGEEPLPKSAGHETTFARDTGNPDQLRATLWLLADRVARRLRRSRLKATTVVVRYKIGHARHSCQRGLQPPTDQAYTLARIGWDLLESRRGKLALRLLGIAGTGLVAAEGVGCLFPLDAKKQGLTRIGDRLRDRFGENALLSGETYRTGSRSRRTPVGFVRGRPR